jgi:FkbM family methyltransferase
MPFLESLQKPQYIFRPRWALRRILTKIGLANASNVIDLPWGARLRIDAKDTVGRALAAQGVYDVVTTEVLWRLTEDAATAFDVGANIGYFTSLLARRVGPKCRVLAFSRSSLIPKRCDCFEGMSRSSLIATCRWRMSRSATLTAKDRSIIFPMNEDNTSYSFLADKPGSKALTVKMVRGEKYLSSNVTLMKIDAQWHEASVLAGLGDGLRAGAIRDIVFEEDAPYPAPSHEILLDAGYKILWFDQRLSGPVVISPDERPKGIQSYEVLPSYLATRDESRARNLLSTRGWQCLKGGAV